MKPNNVSKIILLTIFVTLISQSGCNMEICEPSTDTQTNYSSNNSWEPVIPETMEYQFSQCDESKLYPENGQEGGIGTNIEGKTFRAELKRNSETQNWYAIVKLQNIVNRAHIANASITLNCHIEGARYLSYKLREFSNSGQYLLMNSAIPFKTGKKVGFFHVSHSSGFEFKLGFGIEPLNILQITINSFSTPGGAAVAGASSGSILNIAVDCPFGKYYEVTLMNGAIYWQNSKCYAPDNLIIIGSEITSKFSNNTYASLFVRPHLIYIAKGFSVPISNDCSEQLSMVSVTDGTKLGIGALIYFN